MNQLECSFKFYLDLLGTECLSVSPPAPPPNLYGTVLTPNMMVSGGGAFGRSLGHEGGTLMNGINALRSESTISPLFSTV